MLDLIWRGEAWMEGDKLACYFIYGGLNDAQEESRKIDEKSCLKLANKTNNRVDNNYRMWKCDENSNSHGQIVYGKTNGGFAYWIAARDGASIMSSWMILNKFSDTPNDDEIFQARNKKSVMNYKTSVLSPNVCSPNVCSNILGKFVVTQLMMLFQRYFNEVHVWFMHVDECSFFYWIFFNMSLMILSVNSNIIHTSLINHFILLSFRTSSPLHTQRKIMESFILAIPTSF